MLKFWTEKSSLNFKTQKSILTLNSYPHNFWPYSKSIYKIKYIYIYVYVFIWLHQVFIAECGIFSCSMWDLVPWPGIKPRPPALGVQIFSHWTIREVPRSVTLKKNANLRLSPFHCWLMYLKYSVSLKRKQAMLWVNVWCYLITICVIILTNIMS